MDYKYIEQLLERYWNCETSVDEERILQAFFRQKEIPARLLRYKPLFAYVEAAKEVRLGEDFNARVLARLGRPTVKARRLTPRLRFMPLLKAAGMVAALLAMGTIVQHTLDEKETVVPADSVYGEAAVGSQVTCESVQPIDTVVKAVVDEIRKEKIE